MYLKQNLSFETCVLNIAMNNLLLLLCLLPFAWGQARIQVWGSLMSHRLVYFNALFSLVLNKIWFNYIAFYFLLEYFTLNCLLIYFRNEYMVEGVLEQKKEDWSKYGAEIRRYGTKICSHQVRTLARPVPTCGTAVPPSRPTFAAFLQAQVTLLQLYCFILLVA